MSIDCPGTASDQGAEQDRPKAEDIAFSRAGTAFQNLRRDPRALAAPARRSGSERDERESDGAGDVEADRAGMERTVHHAQRVQRLQGTRELEGKAPHLRCGEPPGLERLAQRVVGQLEDDEVAVAVATGVENRQDVGMREVRSHLHRVRQWRIRRDIARR